MPEKENPAHRHRRHHCLRRYGGRSDTGVDYGTASDAYSRYFRPLSGGLPAAAEPGQHQYYAASLAADGPMHSDTLQRL